ncbi:MAG: hypothetical protein AABZ53_02355 [Planctomycetota bacterium]
MILAVARRLIHLRLTGAARALGIDLNTALNDRGLILTTLLGMMITGVAGSAAGTILVNLNAELMPLVAWTARAGVGAAVQLELKFLRRALMGTLSATFAFALALVLALVLALALTLLSCGPLIGSEVLMAALVVKLLKLFDLNSWHASKLLSAGAALGLSVEVVLLRATLEAAAGAAWEPTLGTAAEGASGTLVESLLKALLDLMTPLGSEVLGATRTLLTELLALETALRGAAGAGVLTVHGVRPAERPAATLEVSFLTAHWAVLGALGAIALRTTGALAAKLPTLGTKLSAAGSTGSTKGLSLDPNAHFA